MSRLVSFIQISLDGRYASPEGDMSWVSHGNDDPGWLSFVEGNARSGGMLIFGRVTYEMIAGFWPTPLAREMQPVVAERMNVLPKLVFSRTLETPSWTNTRVVASDPPA